MEDDPSQHNGSEENNILSTSVISLVVNAQVTRKEVTEFKVKVIPCLLQLKWVGEKEPQDLLQKVVLKGSENSKFLMICQPPGPTGMTRSGVQ